MRFYALMMLLALLSGCRQIQSPQLFALPLTAPPTKSDWEQAMPYLLETRGGRPNRPDPLFSIDSDTVHKSTASCHHGETEQEPVRVEMKAYYAADRLYLRLRWEDPTRNDAMMRWLHTQDGWRNEGQLEDGIGILWDSDSAFSDFSCARACHMTEFGLSGRTFRSRNEMKLLAAGRSLDLWNWKADRTGRNRFADDRFIDSGGMHPDHPSEIFEPNSHLAAESGGAPFSREDRPRTAADGSPIASAALSGVEALPGYLLQPPRGGRGDVQAQSRYESGGWTLILSRSLRTADPGDVRFVPGGPPLSFGLSVMDNATSGHFISRGEHRLQLLSAPKASTITVGVSI